MKYRAAATQIKEIPIIFRGTIEGNRSDNTVILPETFIPSAFELYNMMYRWKFEDLEILDAEEITVIFNGVEYPGIPRIDHETTEYGPLLIQRWYNYNGATNPQPEGIIDAEIPFFITCDNYDGEEQGVYLYVFDNAELSIEISEPGEEPLNKVTLSKELTGNGQIKRFHARFACGENGTLHLNPYVILNGNITIKLCDFAKGGDDYIAGDNEEISFDCYVPVETHALACLDVENVGEYPSIVDAAIVVQYEDFIEPESIVGYEGINLRRGK